MAEVWRVARERFGVETDENQGSYSLLETEAVNFARACLEYNNKRDARKILEKV